MGLDSFNNKWIRALQVPEVRAQLRAFILETVSEKKTEPDGKSENEPAISETSEKVQAVPAGKAEKTEEKLNAEKRQLQEQLTEETRKNTVLYAEWQKMKERTDALEDSLKTEKKTNAGLKQELEDVCAENEALQSSQTKLEDSLKTEKEINAGLKQELEDVCAENEALQFSQTKLEDSLKKEKEINAGLKQELKDARAENEALARHIEQAKTKNKKLAAQLEKLEPIGRAVGGLSEIYEKYCTLPQARREALKTVLDDTDLMTFFVFGTQFENIRTLWEHAKSEQKNLSEEERKIMVETIRYFITQINLLYDPPLYTLTEDPVGTPYDADRHTKAEGSSAYQGEIREVLLPSIFNERKQQFVCKSLVRY